VISDQWSVVSVWWSDDPAEPNTFGRSVGWGPHAPPRAMVGALADPNLPSETRSLTKMLSPTIRPARAPVLTRGGACAPPSGKPRAIDSLRQKAPSSPAKNALSVVSCQLSVVSNQTAPRSVAILILPGAPTSLSATFRYFSATRHAESGRRRSRSRKMRIAGVLHSDSTLNLELETLNCPRG